MQYVLQSMLWVAIALVLYSYLIYPLLMTRLVRRVRSDTNNELCVVSNPAPTVAVIVAAFNEEKHIAARVENLLQQDYPIDRIRILIGSDGSSDRTVRLARSFADARVEVHDFQVNRGKASVLNDLAARASADVLVFTDANTVFRSDTVRRLVAALSDDTAAVCGELILEEPGKGSNQDHQYWNIERRLKAAESAIGGLLGANGGVYAIRRDVFAPLRPDTICDDFIIAMNVAVAGKGLQYVPAAVAYEDTPSDVMAEFHRRVRIGIGNYQALFRHPRYLVGGSFVLSFTYFSHKVLRWLTPHLLIVVFVCSVLLARDSFYLWMAVLQALGYAAAAAAFATRRRVRWPAVVQAALFFAVLNAAFLIGFKRFVFADYRGGWRRTERA